ncbi:MAG: tRNA (adenosine(37)-N6)-threonylcarbamoyltransferase complex ATPase subunit type 1 TsaE [Sulfurimonas sp.]|nr:tRNA (adenosine(37)-N6)-threonylcarbamoyltransferase complex ATPase subunit type 1 TsaE [Sulfurimonas sp.]
MINYDSSTIIPNSTTVIIPNSTTVILSSTTVILSSTGDLVESTVIPGSTRDIVGSKYSLDSRVKPENDSCFSYICDLNNLNILIEKISENIKDGVIILKGDLASGKTTFVKAMALHLGVRDDVTSPTFSLQQCYGDKLFHYDIYNHGLEHFISLGMLEELDRDGLHFVEWGDEKLVEILNNAGINNLTITIDKNEDDSRSYKVDYAHS